MTTTMADLAPPEKNPMDTYTDPPEGAAHRRFSDDEGSIHSASYGTDFVEEEAGEMKQEETLAENETKAVGRLKLVVLFILMLSAIGVALSVYFYVRNSELEEFEDSFNGDAVKVLASLGANVDFTMEAIDSFAANVLSYARGTNQTWPYVTIPDFAVRSGKLLSLSSAFYVNTYPFVTGEQREEWEAYAATHNQWIDESLDIQENFSGYTGPIVKNYTNFDVIHEDSEYEKDVPGLNGTSRTGENIVCVGSIFSFEFRLGVV